MADKKEGRVVLEENELRSKIMEGAYEAFKAVSTTYGPRGRNVMFERGFGRPTYTRDGVSVVEQVFFSDRAKNFGAQALAEASRAANNVSGDGSSATVVFTYNLLANAQRAMASGQHPMEVSETIINDGRTILEKLKTLVIPVEDEKLKDVATVSVGDPLIGQLIAEALLYVGEDGGILTEKAPINDIEREYVDGYYIQSGFTALQSGKKELSDPLVVVSSKRLSSSSDAIDILNGIMESTGMQQGQVPKILFVGNFEDGAYNTIVNTINAHQIDAIIVKTPPMYGELGKYLLEDIAIYADCKPITDTDNTRQFAQGVSMRPYIGGVDKVVANKSEATLFADSETESVRDRIASIKEQIEHEEVAAISEKMKDRVAKLEGKIAIFKIGAPTESTKEEIEYRVEDAINSTRHAYAEGIVAGGGVTLLELSKCDISDITKNALRDTFKQLLINAHYPEQARLEEALKAKPGFGYNLKKSDKLVDVIREGVVDPYVVVREVITHATGMAAETTKVGLGIIFEDSEK